MKTAKKALTLILLCTVILSALCACGDSGKYDGKSLEDSEFIKSESNDDYEYDVYKDYTIITAYIGENKRVNIPSRLGGKSVKGIGENAIGSSMLAIEVVDIPKNVVYIDPSAFSGCTTVTVYTVASGNPVYKSEKGVIYSKDGKSVLHYPSGRLEDSWSIPDGVENVGAYTFANCEDITKIVLPGSVKSIGEYAFHGCDKLISVNLPQGLETIGNYAFYECSALPEVTLPSSLLKIGEHAFDYCISFKKMTIPDSVSEIGDGAFMRCESLKEVTLPSALSKYGYKVFSGCMLLEEFKIAAGNTNFRVSDGVLYSYDGTVLVDFPYGKYERKIEINSGVKTVRAYAFYRDYEGYENQNDDNIESVDFNKVEKIGAYAFANRNAIKIVQLPSSLAEISSTAFNHCMEIQEYRIDSSNKNYIVVDGVLFTADKKTLVSFPTGSDKISYSIPEGTEHVGDYAFSYNTILNELNICKSLKTVGDYGFYQMSACKGTIEFSNALQSIGKYAFSHCLSVDEFIIPDNTLKVIEQGTFECIDGTYEFIIPSGVTEIGVDAFRETGYLVYIEIPNTVKKIDDRAFYDMDDLHNLTVPDSVTEFGEQIVTQYADTDPDKVTLHGSEGSAIQKYAEENNIPFEVKK